MTSFSLEKDIAFELIDTKLSTIRKVINELIEKWDVQSGDQLITLSRNGELPESELDAIAMTNLIDNLEKYEKLKLELSG